MSLESDEASALSRRRYESLLDAADTHREALVVRLCGEVGLRPAELASLTPGAAEQVRTDPPRYLLRVPGDEDGGRTAYLPVDVERDLRRYAGTNGLAADDPLFSVTPRRLQMLVADVAERASERAGDPSLATISTSDLRRHFARVSLTDREINPRAVKAAGGWRSFESLEPYLSAPTDAELVDAFEPVERPKRGERTEPSPTADDDGVRSLLAASDRYALVHLDVDGVVERWSPGAAATFGVEESEVVGTHVSALYADEALEDDVPERALAAALEEGRWEGASRLRRADGRRFRGDVGVVPRRDGGRHRGYVLLVEDAAAERGRLESLRAERDELERLYAVATRFRAVTAALLEATDHEVIETDTCAALTDGSAYEFAWIERSQLADGRRTWRTSSGLEPSQVERLVPDGEAAGDEPDGPAGDRRPAAGGDGDESPVSVATDVTATVDGTAFSGAVATVPLAYGETVYGTLAVATERSDVGPRERAWLETLGRQVGYAVAAVRRRNLLLSDRVLELEFVCRDADSFFVDATERLDCRFELDSIVPVSESTQLYYARLEGAPPEEVFDVADEDPGIGDRRLIETGPEGWRLEFVVEGSSPTLTLTEYGATVGETVVEDGAARITAECAADADLRTIVTGLRSAFPDSELVGKRETERAVQTAREFRAGLEDRLTDRQEAALRAAYSGGYYDWPRESTAEEIADAMDVSSPTLHNHLRKGQHELLRTFFDGPSGDE